MKTTQSNIMPTKPSVMKTVFFASLFFFGVGCGEADTESVDMANSFEDSCLAYVDAWADCYAEAGLAPGDLPMDYGMCDSIEADADYPYDFDCLTESLYSLDCTSSNIQEDMQRAITGCFS